jgi:acyl-CoA synthetase (AMP-forming)/AMP-acid ligase II
VKDEFLDYFPNLIMTDSIGASESGATGILKVKKGETAMKSGPTVSPISGAVVITDEGEEVVPGSGVVGKVARTGWIPLGYYNDPVKTAETFLNFNGKRYVVPGDSATVEADGSITLLGRGSQSINSGGEKIYPEEVEAAVKSHPSIYDAVVVGVPDEKWGQRVAAVVQLRDGVSPDVDLILESVQSHCRTKVSGYKLPRELHIVDEIQRSPSGKPDYPWAKKIATGA